MAWSIILTIEDAKNKKSSVQFNMDATQSFDAVRLVAQGLATIVGNIIHGVVRAINVSNNVDLPGGLNTTPNDDADVEEGAKFQFITEFENYTSLRIPTIEEVFLLPSGEVDTTDPEIALLVGAVLGTYDFDPDPIGAVGDIMTDQRNEDITALVWARENFLSSRGSR